MRILFNPVSGALIHDFIVSGKLLDSHPAGELRQYEDHEAQALLEVYEFLQEVEAVDAKKIMGKAETVVAPTSLQCSVCGKEFALKLALAGHQRSHKDVDFSKFPQEKKDEFDLSDIPVAGGKKVLSQNETNAVAKNYELTGNLDNGTDRDGVDWYGTGLTEERGSLSKVTPIGQRGHFGA